MLKDLAPDIPIINQCHATGFRQMALCPGIAGEVRNGVRRNDAFVVLHRDHQQRLCDELNVDPARVHLVGAGYRNELFHSRGRNPTPHPSLLFVGKYSASKGLPQLLEAVERLQLSLPNLVLHVAGSGSGNEASGLAARMALMPSVQLHGQLSQEQLAELARTSWACVLPSFYEGIPLVLVEALACGCRLVATELPGIKEQLQPHLGELMTLIPLPGMIGVDTPDPDEIPHFVDALVDALQHTLEQPPLDGPSFQVNLERYTWQSVFEKVETIWKEQL